MWLLDASRATHRISQVDDGLPERSAHRVSRALGDGVRAAPLLRQMPRACRAVCALSGARIVDARGAQKAMRRNGGSFPNRSPGSTPALAEGCFSKGALPFGWSALHAYHGQNENATGCGEKSSGPPLGGFQHLLQMVAVDHRLPVKRRVQHQLDTARIGRGQDLPDQVAVGAF